MNEESRGYLEYEAELEYLNSLRKEYHNSLKK